MRLRRLGIRGDTIIEVMLAVAVVGVTIAGAYGIATRSLKSARQAQERGEALKIAEGQVEAIKAIASSPSTADDGNAFVSGVRCFNGTTPVTGFGSGWGSEIKPLAEDNLDGYPADCVKNTLYHVVVSGRTLSDSEPNRWHFKVSIRWFSLGNNLKDELTLDYRAYRK